MNERFAPYTPLPLPEPAALKEHAWVSDEADTDFAALVVTPRVIDAAGSLSTGELAVGDGGTLLLGCNLDAVCRSLGAPIYDAAPLDGLRRRVFGVGLPIAKAQGATGGGTDTAFTLGTWSASPAGSNASARVLTAPDPLTLEAGGNAVAGSLLSALAISGDALDAVAAEIITINGNDQAGDPIAEATLRVDSGNTVQTLMTAIETFHGLSAGAVTISSGVLVVTFPAGAGAATLTLAFEDTPVAQVLTADAAITLEAGGNAVAGSLLSALAQTGDALDGGAGETIRITGDDATGTPIAPVDVRVDSGNTVQTLLTAIETFFGGGTASIAAGVITYTAPAGASQRTLGLALSDSEAPGTTTYDDFPVAFTETTPGQGTTTYDDLPLAFTVTAAGAAAVARVLTGSTTFTVAGPANATAATPLASLTQLTGALDAGLDTIALSGKTPDNSDWSGTYTYQTGDTLGTLCARIEELIEAEQAASVAVAVTAGKIVITDSAAGSSATSLTATFGDIEGGSYLSAIRVDHVTADGTTLERTTLATASGGPWLTGVASEDPTLIAVDLDAALAVGGSLELVLELTLLAGDTAEFVLHAIPDAYYVLIDLEGQV